LEQTALGRSTDDKIRWILGRWVVRMGGGWDWLRIVSNGGEVDITGSESCPVAGFGISGLNLWFCYHSVS